MCAFSILLLGDAERSEFADAHRDLERWGTVSRFKKMAAAESALAQGDVVPDLIVVVQAFPGQFSHETIDRLRRLAPLARIVGLMGSWCEGEMRTGSPWPGVVRTYGHQWAARCNRELGRLTRGECCSWTLPPTATEEERLLADAAERRPSRQGLVAIYSRTHEMAEWLSAACQSRGYATIWQRPPNIARVAGAMATIFDGSDLSPDECSQLGRLTAALHPAPVVALLAFPRAEDRRRALSAGAATVLSKPPAVDDLFWELEKVAV